MLHPADRLMLRLIKIPFLADRIQGMLYQVNFEESVVLLEKVSQQLFCSVRLIQS